MIAGFVLIFATCGNGYCQADSPVTEVLYKSAAECEQVKDRLAHVYTETLACGEVWRDESKEVGSAVTGG